MNSKLLSDFLKPTIITGQQYGTKISVEIDHSDTDIDELFEAFRTLVAGLGYSDTTWKECIMERAEEYKEEEDEILQSQKDRETFFDAITNPDQPTREAIKGIQDYLDGLNEKQIDEALAEHNAHEEGYENWGEQLEEQFWKEQPPEPFATPEEVEMYNIGSIGADNSEFDDYGKRIVKPTKKIGRRGIKKK